MRPKQFGSNLLQNYLQAVSEYLVGKAMHIERLFASIQKVHR
jgi:hypothetical protein